MLEFFPGGVVLGFASTDFRLSHSRFDEAMGLALRKLAISTDPQEKLDAEGWIDKVNIASPHD